MFHKSKVQGFFEISKVTTKFALVKYADILHVFQKTSSVVKVIN